MVSVAVVHAPVWYFPGPHLVHVLHALAPLVVEYVTPTVHRVHVAPVTYDPGLHVHWELRVDLAGEFEFAVH